MSATRLDMRVSPAFKRRIERLAEQRNTTMAGAVRVAVIEATKGDGGVPSEQELLELLGEAARCGSVAAMRELLRHHREHRTSAAMCSRASMSLPRGDPRSDVAAKRRHSPAGKSTQLPVDW
jgi:hypothetical protein